MVQSKYILGLLILIVVLMSGCVNSNKSTNQLNESKVINLDAQQLILNDSEMKEVLGDEWKKVNTHNAEMPLSSSGISMIYDTNSSNTNGFPWYWRATSGEMILQPVDISLYVYTDIAEAKEVYFSYNSIKDYKGNKINIGDDGNIYTFDSIIEVTFIKNNVISFIYLSANESELLNMNTAIELSQKQDAKISRILEMIK